MSSDPPTPPALRDERGRLLPGQTANRKGRPRSGLALAEAIREDVDPRELIRIAVDIARGLPVVQDLEHLRAVAAARAKGEPDPPIAGVSVVWPTEAGRIGALRFLAEYGWQKPVVQTELTVGQGVGPMLDYTRLSQDDLDKLEALQAKAAGVVTAGQVAGALDVTKRR